MFFAIIKDGIIVSFSVTIYSKIKILLSFLETLKVTFEIPFNPDYALVFVMKTIYLTK